MSQVYCYHKYDGAGRLEQETRLGKDDALISKILYKYNPAGKQVGYLGIRPSWEIAFRKPFAHAERDGQTAQRARTLVGTRAACLRR